MYRLSLKLFVVLAIVAGPVLGFAPDASAHKRTGSKGPVRGFVQWPERPKSHATLPDFDLRRSVGTSNLSLDLRRVAGTVGTAGTNAGGLLNGCRLKGGNTAPGLPVLDPVAGGLAVAHDLCFFFESLSIQSAGLWEKRKHVTDFDCVASGTSGASGSPLDPSVLPTLGAFYGEFTCDGNPVLGADNPVKPEPNWVPSADGHFHGLSLGSTTIGFLGEVHCTVSRTVGGRTANCPQGPENDLTKVANSGVDRSRIKHTLACKGEVVPDPTAAGTDSDGDLVPDTAQLAAVALNCTIA